MTPEKILNFWLDEIDSKQWYKSSKKLDTTILKQFYSVWAVSYTHLRAHET